MPKFDSSAADKGVGISRFKEKPMIHKAERRLITIHYQAAWGEGAKGGLDGNTNDDIESLKAHLAKYAPKAVFIGADCYDKDGKYLHSYEAETEAGEPIRADLLLEAGWVGVEYMDGYIYEKVFYNSDGYCRGFVKVDIKKYNYDNKPTSPSVCLVTFADGYDLKPKVEIPLKRIKTMEGLGQLIEMLG